MAKKRRTDTPCRGEISEKVDKGKDDVSERAERLDTVAADSQTVGETLDGLTLEGTSEAAEQIEGAIEQAQDVTHEVFEREDDELGGMLTEVQEYENELQERADASGSDLEEVSQATDEITTEETKRELEQAQTELQGDLDFLQEQRNAARQSREENERLRQEYRGRMQGERR